MLYPKLEGESQIAQIQNIVSNQQQTQADTSVDTRGDTTDTCKHALTKICYMSARAENQQKK